MNLSTCEYGRNNRKRLLKLFICMLTVIICIQGPVTLTAEGVDDSAIESNKASYGYSVDTYKNNTKSNMTPA
ncbi:hypothetical protein GI584_03515 [Gracilibacillus salitolerans]|uniref:Uncharacterized protein n=1 Tax=Gracilibacillus salitolerans TaxID=2663022 RepID=A0A5Q2TG95_9BACI|nr:hypothetical protein [Gracilibacillus salitolerans]QGH33162.1 hypothetical protein GI584_03515 [Gracilibacillus salitolerans]